MKNRHFIIFFFALLSINFSCDDIGKELSALKPKEINPYAVNSGDENTDIINFNNKLIELEDNHKKLIEPLYEDLEKASYYVNQRLNNPSNTYVQYYPAVRRSMVGTIDQLEAPTVLGKPFQDLVDETIENYKELKEIHSSLKEYMKLSDWEKDDGADILKMEERTDALVYNHGENIAKLFDMLEKKADEAEESILASHPLKKQILQSREILDLSYEVLLYTYEIDEPDYMEQMNKNYSKLESLYRKNNKTKIPTTYKNKRSSFEKFNDATADFLAQIKTVQDAVMNNAKNLESELNYLESRREHIRSSYNRFVQ